jgi:hypothetical protein
MSKTNALTEQAISLKLLQTDNEKKIPTLCFKRMIIMSIASFVLTSFLIYLKSCSNLLSMIGLFFNIISWIILVIYSFIVYYKKKGRGLKR